MARRDFLLPDLGEGLTEGQMVAWRVEVGDLVDVDQPLADVETEKATVELPSPFAGRVTHRHADVGDEVAVGRPLVTVEVDEPAPSTGDSPNTSGGEPDGLLVGYGTPGEGAGRRAAGTDGRATPPPDGANRPLAKPPVRKLAKDLGVDLAAVRASGPGGVITREDVEAVARGERGDADAGERTPLSGVRKRIARRMAHVSREVPQVFASRDCDATELVELARELDAGEPEVRVSPLAVVLRACVAGLSRFPALNSRFDAESEELVLPRAVNLGFAAHTPRGLLVPVIHGAEQLSTLGLAGELGRLAAAARDDTVTPAELTGGTFTVSNYGSLGVDDGQPLINHPEAAILGLGRIAERPWVVEGELAVRHVVTLTLGFDHRVCDGGEAAGFLGFLGDCVERPATLLAAL